VSVVNSMYEEVEGPITFTIEIINLDGTKVFTHEGEIRNIPPDSTQTVYTLPPTKTTPTYFLRLRLLDSGEYLIDVYTLILTLQRQHS
jgi:hypothetical protein